MMNNDIEEYTPVDICRRFGIPRTTLFRWEQTGEIPKAERVKKDRRIYRRHHVKRIAELLREKLHEEIRSALKHNPNGAYPTLEMQERLYMFEFFGEKNPKHGLQQLRGLAVRKALSPKTVEVLAGDALSRSPQDTVRAKIWEVLATNDQVTT